MQTDDMAPAYLAALNNFMLPYGENGGDGDDDGDDDDDDDEEEGEEEEEEDEEEEEEEGRGSGAGAVGYAAPPRPQPAAARAASAPGVKAAEPVKAAKRKKEAAQLTKQERAEFNALKKARAMAQGLGGPMHCLGRQAAYGASQGQQGVHMQPNQQDPHRPASYQPHELKSAPAMGARIVQPMPGQRAAHGAAWQHAHQVQQGVYMPYQQGQQQPASYLPVGLQMQPASYQAVEGMQLGMYMGTGMPAAVPWQQQHQQLQQQHQQQIRSMRLLQMQEQQHQQQQQRRILEMALGL
jgi:hypothetical protein